MTTLSLLQQQLIKHKLDAYIITRNNMFLGQDVLPQENKVLELSGFSGSAGSLIVFRNKTFLLVDGRYDIQARAQTKGQDIEVICTRDSIGTWLKDNIKDACKIAYDPWCHSIAEVDYWKRSLDNFEFVEDKNALLGSRILKSEPDIFELKEEFSGISSDEKISYLTKFCQDNRLDGYLLCECDCVSWLLNLRSNLIPYTPVLRAYALVLVDGSTSLFLDDFSKLEKELDALKGKRIGAAFNRCPRKLYSLMKERKIWVANLNNPVTDWKSTKNEVEVAGFRAAHLRDGVALCQFLYWLDNNWHSTDELGVVAKLHAIRAQRQNYYSESFATIAACGPNGAIVHYQPTQASNHPLSADTVLLLDSGAQYFDGTTDVTRTIALGSPSPEIIKSYTQVLKSHIAVATSLFPPLTPGLALDTVARAALWRFGKDYAHGTGHGVGHFLAVHEGPQSLSLKSLAPLKKDMITSIEPGFYQEGQYGIRLENLALIKEVTTDFISPMLGFEPLTLVPFDKRLIDKSLLSSDEINWLNNYHQTVYTKVSPHLKPDEAAWLKSATAKL